MGRTALTSRQRAGRGTRAGKLDLRLLAAAAVVAALLGTAYWLGTRQARTITTEREVVREIRVTLDDERLEKISDEIVQKVSSSESGTTIRYITSSGDAEKAVTVTQTTRRVEKDPVTGNTTAEVETTRTETTEVSEHSASSTSESQATHTATQVGTTTTSESTVHATTHSTSDSTENMSETVVEKPAVSELPGPSRLGLAVDMKLRPMLTFDVARLSRYALAAVAEVDMSRPRISGAGAAITAELNSRRDYFAGVYGIYDFDEQAPAVGVMIGRKF